MTTGLGREHADAAVEGRDPFIHRTVVTILQPIRCERGVTQDETCERRQRYWSGVAPCSG